MKQGYYYTKSPEFERCYYLTGTKKGNRWISIRINGLTSIKPPEWSSLCWMCLPDDDELNEVGYEYKYFETNPTQVIDPKQK